MSMIDTAVVRPVVSLGKTTATTAQVALSRQIACGCSVKFEGAGADVVLDIDLAGEAVPDYSDALVMGGPFGTIELAQGSRLLRALTGIDISAENQADQERWPWLQAALVGRLAGTPFAGVDSLARTGLTGAAEACTLRISLCSGTHALVSHGRASAAAWLGFMAQSSWTRSLRPASAFGDLPWQTTVSIGSHSLPGHLLRKLTAGDIILPSSPRFSSNGEGGLRIAGLHARVRYLAPAALTITAMENGMDLQDTEHDASEEAVEAAASALPPPGEGLAVQDNLTALDMLPLTLCFELGRLCMPLAELRALRVGSIIPLAGGSPAAIAIVANGSVLGRGEAVDVSGQLGIRIIQWGSA
ncbi:type III secretion system cytoplasmic ring protein SctQ [Collimonas humicola]|uniref:type III secretion system cytoplasmic ring protein SctQ n=1 Tax=Collimonas humicola TaxID=2825886 RepID=UPI001B8C9062|nr:type III secretion system cytoplasmic ring protein SctQ [Collimonas humicola]